MVGIAHHPSIACHRPNNKGLGKDEYASRRKHTHHRLVLYYLY